MLVKIGMEFEPKVYDGRCTKKIGADFDNKPTKDVAVIVLKEEAGPYSHLINKDNITIQKTFFTRLGDLLLKIIGSRGEIVMHNQYSGHPTCDPAYLGFADYLGSDCYVRVGAGPKF